MRQTQLEKDFIHWLRERAKGVERRFGRSFESEDGDMDDDEYCVECIGEVQKERKASKNPCCIIYGWDEAPETDSEPRCEKCGCGLMFSPTSHFIKGNIEWLEETNELDAGGAELLHVWLDGMGDYSRDEMWPMIAAHAKRIMKRAGMTCVPNGWITFTPSDQHDWCRSYSVWLSIYQHFARLLSKWIDTTGKGEQGWLCDTSGINVRSFQVIDSKEKAEKCVRKLLSSAGEDNDRGDFLRSINLWSGQEMDKPIRIKDQRCDWPEFGVRGRQLKVSPNEFHTDAVILTHSSMQLSACGKFWRYEMGYSDNHYEPTSWCVSISQRDQKEWMSLPVFMDAIVSWKEDILKPEEETRKYRGYYGDWDAVHDSLRRLFYFPMGEHYLGVELTDQFMNIKGYASTKHRVEMNRRKLSILESWIKQALEIK